MRRRMTSAALAAVLAATTLGVDGCSRAIDGTALAAPGQAGLAAKANTSCRDFVGMTQSGRQDVIAAIGQDGNKILADNPDQWVAVASALCRFVDPSAPVKDILPGGMR
jgi:hypothetical protein